MNREDDNISNISQPPQDILKIFFLQRQNDALESIRAYLHRKAHSGGGSTLNVTANVQTLYLDLEPHLAKNHKEEDLIELEKLAFSKDVENVIKAYKQINTFLYKLNLKRIDTRKKYDTTSVEAENAATGL